MKAINSANNTKPNSMRSIGGALLRCVGGKRKSLPATTRVKLFPHTFAEPGAANHRDPAFPLRRRSPNPRFGNQLAFKSHGELRPPQTPAAPPSLLIENASNRDPP